MIASSKKSDGLLGPDAQPGGVDGLHQIQNIAPVEPAAEVPCGGRIGDSLGIQGVEINLVVAEPLEMLELGAAGQDVEGDVQDVVGLVVGAGGA